MIEIDFSKQLLMLSLEQFKRSFFGNLDRNGNKQCFSFFKKQRNYFGLFKKNGKNILNVLYTNLILPNIISV